MNPFILLSPDERQAWLVQIALCTNVDELRKMRKYLKRHMLPGALVDEELFKAIDDAVNTILQSVVIRNGTLVHERTGETIGKISNFNISHKTNSQPIFKLDGGLVDFAHSPPTTRITLKMEEEDDE